jgi:hypothetical protein
MPQCVLGRSRATQPNRPRCPAHAKRRSPEIYGTFLDRLDQTQDRMAALFHLAGHIGLRRGSSAGRVGKTSTIDNRMLVVQRQIADLVVSPGSRVRQGMRGGLRLRVHQG